jgi:hypothetical protein
MNITHKIMRLHYKGKPVGFMRFADPVSAPKYLDHKVIQYCESPDLRWSGSPADFIRFDAVELLEESKDWKERPLGTDA